jgi:DNA-binding response OmpR family regulator
MKNNSQLQQNRSTILLVEDNPHIMDANSEALKLEGYRVLEAETIAQAKILYERESPDLIVLDIMLPDGDGISFCKELRRDSKTPVLFLTALGQKDERLAGLGVGGDDYLPKPYDIDELIARIAVIIRRSDSIPDTITKGNLVIKIPSSQVVVNGEAIRLSQNEFSLLLVFVQNEGKVFDEAQLYYKVWGQKMESDNQAVQAAISRLRKKIGSSGYNVVHLREQGYVFDKS